MEIEDTKSYDAECVDCLLSVNSDDGKHVGLSNSFVCNKCLQGETKTCANCNHERDNKNLRYCTDCTEDESIGRCGHCDAIDEAYEHCEECKLQTCDICWRACRKCSQYVCLFCIIKHVCVEKDTYVRPMSHCRQCVDCLEWVDRDSGTDTTGRNFFQCYKCLRKTIIQ